MNMQEIGILAGLVALPISGFGVYLSMRTARVGEQNLRQTVRKNDLDTVNVEIATLKTGYELMIRNLELNYRQCQEDLAAMHAKLDLQLEESRILRDLNLKLVLQLQVR